MRDEGLSDNAIATSLDDEHDRIWDRINKKHAKMFAQMEEDDYDGSDPLAGDVDHWVHPDETKDV